jgi:phosphate/sulfate permease
MNDNAKYCLACGEKIEEDVFDTQTGQIINTYNDDAYTKPENSTTILVCGAMSIIFCILNYVGIPFVHLVGITFGIIGARLANQELFQNRFSTECHWYIFRSTRICHWVYVWVWINIIIFVLSIIILRLGSELNV